jgi:hypothetical protein
LAVVQDYGIHAIDNNAHALMLTHRLPEPTEQSSTLFKPAVVEVPPQPAVSRVYKLGRFIPRGILNVRLSYPIIDALEFVSISMGLHRVF